MSDYRSSPNIKRGLKQSTPQTHKNNSIGMNSSSDDNEYQKSIRTTIDSGDSQEEGIELANITPTISSPSQARSVFHTTEAFESIDFYSSLQVDYDDDDDEDEVDVDTESLHTQQLLSGEDVNETPVQSRTSTPIGVDHRTARLPKTKSEFYVNVLKPILKFTRSTQVKSVMFLTVLGIGGSILNLVIDTCISGIEGSHIRVASLTRFYAINYLLYCLFAVLFGLLAASCVDYISPHSAGSGVPEMKSILAGNAMDRYLTFRTLVAKGFGIIAGLGAGLQIGRLGPFVHISSCLGNLLLKSRFFHKLRKQEYERISLLSATSALGVASTFGAPIGGVLFSIEVTSTYYPVANLWRCLFCTLFGSFFFYIWRKLDIIAHYEIALFSTDFPPFPYQITEILLFIVVGMFCGLFGAFFNFLYTKTVELRERFKIIEKYRYRAVAAVALLTAIISFPTTPLMRYSPNYVVNLLFSNNDLPTKRPILNLSITLVAKYLLTIWALVLPLPCGLFLPVFAIGAVMGRLFAEILRSTGFLPEIMPAYYAVACAAGMSAGVTRALSTVVVVFELTGQLSLLLPVMITILVAAGVGNLFNEDIYDRILNIRGLPMPLPEVQKQYNTKLIAKDLMQPAEFISADYSIDDLEDILERSKHSFYPIVDNQRNRSLIGVAKREDLVATVNEYLRSYEFETTAPPSVEANLSKDQIDNKTDEGVPNSEQQQQLQLIIDSDRPKVVSRRHRISSTISFADFNPRNNNNETIQIGSYEIPISANPKMVLKSNITGKEYAIPYDASPLSIPIFTPYTKIHFLFSMLRLGVLWVTVDGKLCGVVTKNDMMSVNVE